MRKTKNFPSNGFRANEVSARSCFFCCFYFLTKTKIRKKSVLCNFNWMINWTFGCPRIIRGCPRWVIVSIPAPCGIKNLMDAQPLHQHIGQGLSLALLVHLLKARLLRLWIRAVRYSWHEHGQSWHMTICISKSRSAEAVIWTTFFFQGSIFHSQQSGICCIHISNMLFARVAHQDCCTSADLARPVIYFWSWQ